MLTIRPSQEPDFLEVYDATEREERFQSLVQEILPEVRRRHLRYSVEQLYETAVQLAAFRLADEATKYPALAAAP